MVFYGITLVPLAEEIRAADRGILSPFYVDDTVFDGSSLQSAQVLKLLMKRGPDWGYSPDPDKSLFILDTPGQEEAAKREFLAEGLTLKFVSGSRYLRAYLGLQERLEAWVKPQVEAWDHVVIVLGKKTDDRPSRITPAWECRCNFSGSTSKGLSLELAL